MGDSSQSQAPWVFGTMTGRWFSHLLGSRASPAPMDVTPAARGELKRRASPSMDVDEETSPTKRVKRSPPPPVVSRMRTEPLSNNRRAGSVKALDFNDVHDSGRPRTLLSSLHPERPAKHKSRGLSSGLSQYLGSMSMQTPSATPGAGRSSMTGRTAGVASMAHNVHKSFNAADSGSFRGSVAGSVDPGEDDRMSAQPQRTPVGASFGPSGPSLDRMSLSSIGRNGSQTPSLRRPTLERHNDLAPFASRSGGSVKSSRLGDNSLRVRTTSLISISAGSNSSRAPSNAPHSARAPSVGRSNGRTTPTPRDGHISSPPITSPGSSIVGSPPLSANPLPHAQRAIELRDSLTTTLKHTRSFSSPYFGRLKVPLPSASSTGKRSSISGTSDQRSDNHSRSQSANSATSAASATSSKTDTSSKAESRAAPYSVGGSKSQGKKILEKRRAEEKELASMNLIAQEGMDDFRVEPIKKAQENGTKSMDADKVSLVSSTIPSPQSQLLQVPPSSVSESNSGTSSKTVKVKPAHTLEKRTRIPEKDVMRRFNPATNERLIRAKNAGSGRYSLPPDDDDDAPGVEQMKQIQEKTTPMVLPETFKIEKFGAGSNAPSGGISATKPESTGSDAMNISPIKEKYDQPDSPADMMSTTPTESSVRNTFKITPIVKPAEPATTNPFGTIPTAGATFGGQAAPPSNGFSTQETKNLFGSTPTAAPAPTAVPPPNAESSSSAFGTAPTPAATTSAPMQFSFGAPPAPKPAAAAAAPAPLPFSFGTAPSVPAPSAHSPTLSAPTNGFSLFGQPNDKKSPPPPTVIVTEAPQPISSFFAAPNAGTTTSNGEASRSSLFGAPAQPNHSAPKPLFSFPSAKEPEATPVEPKKDAPPIFSFGALPAATAMTTPVKPAAAAPFSFGTTPTATPTTTEGTPSPQKPMFSFPSTTPASSLPPLNSTTPLGTPFSFEGTPSPTRPALTGRNDSAANTPTKSTFSFGAPSTTPLVTPTTTNNLFSFGNKPASTTPAETPSAPFSFGTTPSSASKTPAPFNFGTTPTPTTTTPAAPPPSAGGFSFNFGGNTDLKNPFQATTPSPTKPFTFGNGPTSAPPSAPSFSFGSSAGDATPTAKPVSGFNFGQSQSSTATPTPTPTTTSGFSFGTLPTNAPAPTSNGLLFPSGPRTPLTKVLELDGMDTSPIRGGGNTPGGPSFNSASGNGFSFGAPSSANGGFASAPPSAHPFSSGAGGGFGAQGGSGFGGGFAKESSPAPTPSPFSFGGAGTASGAFGQPAANSSLAPTSAGGFGSNSGFNVTPISPAVASPFNQSQGFGSPAASPFTQPATLGGGNPFGAPSQGGSVGSALEFNAGASDGSDGRKLIPMPKPRRNRTQQETRGLLQKARQHGF